MMLQYRDLAKLKTKGTLFLSLDRSILFVSLLYHVGLYWDLVLVSFLIGIGKCVSSFSIFISIKMSKYIVMIFFYFLKIIFNINISK